MDPPLKRGFIMLLAQVSGNCPDKSIMLKTFASTGTSSYWPALIILFVILSFPGGVLFFNLLKPLKGISAEFQVIRGFSQKIPADLLSYNKIHS